MTDWILITITCDILYWAMRDLRDGTWGKVHGTSPGNTPFSPTWITKPPPSKTVTLESLSAQSRIQRATLDWEVDISSPLVPVVVERIAGGTRSRRGGTRGRLANDPG